MSDSKRAREQRKLKRQLVVRADRDCASCGGSGLRVNNRYDGNFRKLEVTVDVCPCVRVLPEEVDDADQ